MLICTILLPVRKSSLLFQDRLNFIKVASEKTLGENLEKDVPAEKVEKILKLARSFCGIKQGSGVPVTKPVMNLMLLQLVTKKIRDTFGIEADNENLVDFTRFILQGIIHEGDLVWVQAKKGRNVTGSDIVRVYVEAFQVLQEGRVFELAADNDCDALMGLLEAELDAPQGGAAVDPRVTKAYQTYCQELKTHMKPGTSLVALPSVSVFAVKHQGSTPGIVGTLALTNGCTGFCFERVPPAFCSIPKEVSKDNPCMMTNRANLLLDLLNFVLPDTYRAALRAAKDPLLELMLKGKGSQVKEGE